MKAWIENGVVRDVCQGDPEQTYHPDIAALYSADVPDGVLNGATLIDGVWTNPAPVPTPVPPAPDPAIAKAAKWNQIKGIRDLKVQSGGYKVNVATVPKWFHSDTFSRTQQMGLVMFGPNCPAVPWKTMDGSYVTMSQALAGQIFQAAAVQDQAVFGRAEALKVAVDASENPDSVDITAGWPETFQGV